MKKKELRKDFLWGAALSNVQAEGGYLEDGKGLNVYDTLVVTPEPGIESQYSDTKVATDHYHHFKEDIDLMAEMGIKAYRFSIIWSRIHPNGDDEANEKGLDFYEEMIDYMLSKGIEPVVSLVHFDMPDHLMRAYNGFLNKKVIDFYVENVRCISKIMNDFELNAKMIKRRNKYVVYLKSSEKIGDFLRAIGASQSVMNFESTRIDRNMSNTVNRWNNCDIANEIKSMATANKQINDINTVDMFMGLDMLDEKTRIVALIRKKYPEMTLNELTEVYYEETGKTISKSGLHHRFKKISEEAKRLIQMENE